MPRTYRLAGLVVSALLTLAACGTDGTGDVTGLVGIKIGFIFVGERDDLGYNQAAWEGADAVAKAFPNNQVLRRENVPETPVAQAVMEEMIEEGAGLLVATSFGHLTAAAAIARDHPDVVVVHQGGVEPAPLLPNLGTYWGAVYESVYQAGIVAGASTQTDRLGYVVAHPIPATFANVNAFTLGARSVNPQVQTFVRSTGSWCDPAAQAAMAEELIDAGVDVITQHQDCTRTILERTEAAGLGAIGYHSDGSEVAPRSWLVGAVWNWGPLYTEIVRTVLSGQFTSSPYNADHRASYASAQQPFLLTDFSPSVPRPARAKARAAAAGFARGGSPFQGPIRDRDGRLRIPPDDNASATEVDEMDYFVDGVVGDLTPERPPAGQPG